MAQAHGSADQNVRQYIALLDYDMWFWKAIVARAGNAGLSTDAVIMALLECWSM